MSSSIAAAKKRRANINPNQSTPVSTNASAASGNSKNMPLPQYLALMEKRILTLEKMVQSQKSSVANSAQEVVINTTSETNMNEETLKATFEEYDARFEMLVVQLNDMKEMLLKLQTYTMGVNKMLLENASIIAPSTSEETISNMRLDEDGGIMETPESGELPTFTISP
jgi:hypothetical protein